jgi:hypothetical protein
MKFRPVHQADVFHHLPPFAKHSKLNKSKGIMLHALLVGEIYNRLNVVAPTFNIFFLKKNSFLTIGR